MNRWEWRVPKSHGKQPTPEWWLEQVAVVIVRVVAFRARARGDRQTYDRMRALALAGSQAENAPFRPESGDR